MSAQPTLAKALPDNGDDIEETIVRLRCLARAYEETIARLVNDNAYLTKENAQLWDAVHEYQDAAVQR